MAHSPPDPPRRRRPPPRPGHTHLRPRVLRAAGKNVLVTGGSSGIGQAIAVRFADGFDAHLTECPDCVEYVAQMRRTIVAVGLSATELERTPAVTALLQVFRDWKRGMATG